MDPPGLDESLRRLLRQRMIRRAEPQGTYQFTQTLARDTVYAMTRKELRATWHLALADRLSQRAHAPAPSPSPSSFEESSQGDLAHHLEAACLLKREVRPDDPLLPELTVRAARVLVAEGAHALHRKDLPAAVALLERGRELLPRGDPEHRRLAVRICDSGLLQGDGERAFAALDVAERMLPGDPRTSLTCAIQRETLAVRFGLRPPALDPLRELLAADPGDDLSWCRFHELEALVRLGEGRFADAEAALREGLARAHAQGDRYEENRLLGGVCELTQWSSTPIPEGLALCAELSATFAGDRALLVPVLTTRARLLALSGEVSEARLVLATASRHAADLHLELAATVVAQVSGLVESLDGRHAAAETLFRRAAAGLRDAGQPAPAATLEIYAARELLRQGRHEEAARMLDGVTGAEGANRVDGAEGVEGAEDMEDVDIAGGVQLQLRGELILLALRAHLEAVGGGHRKALALAAEAERLLDGTDDPCLRGDVLTELADVYRTAGSAARAADAADRAWRHYTAKGAALPAGRLRRTWQSDRETDR